MKNTKVKLTVEVVFDVNHATPHHLQSFKYDLNQGSINLTEGTIGSDKSRGNYTRESLEYTVRSIKNCIN